MPAEWLLLNRLQWGLNSNFAKLQATGPWPKIWGDAVRGATELVRPEGVEISR